MNKRKSGKIELMRFIFTMCIVLYHCQRHYLKEKIYFGHFSFFKNGYIGVEFFFLLTGFFMARSVYNMNKNNNTCQIPDLGAESVGYVWKKVKSILPYHFSAFALILIGTAIYEQQSLKQFVKMVFNSLPGALLFSKTGFNFGKTNRVEWYIVCMIFSMLVLYPICRKYYSIFVHVAAPVGGIFLLGYLYQNYGTFVGGGVSNWNGFVFVCMIRSLAEIALGATCFEVSRRLGDVNVSRHNRILLTILENSCYLFELYFVISTLSHDYEIYALLALMISIILTFSGVTFGNSVFDNGICYFLGANSLVIYLSQVLPLDMVKKLFAECSGYEKMFIMVVFTIINAVVCKMLGNIFLKTVRWNMRKA